MEIKSGKSYTVKDWFGNKVAQEVQSNISMCDVFAVLKETDKAVYAMLNLGCQKRKTMWVPKSVLIEREIHEVPFEASAYETYIIADYDEASARFTEMWKGFM